MSNNYIGNIGGLYMSLYGVFGPGNLYSPYEGWNAPSAGKVLTVDSSGLYALWKAPVTGVTSFNGATGAVTGVTSVNGQTGAVTVAGNIGTWHNRGALPAGNSQNTTGKTMFVAYMPSVPHTSFIGCYFYVDGLVMWQMSTDNYAVVTSSAMVPVPPWSTYSFTCAGAIREYY